jgi:protein-S-isoprenylcysteine O-methyltransferase Ste14
MRAIYRRNISEHREVMQHLYVRGVMLAGAFNFLPGRTAQRSLIPETPELGYVIIAAVMVWAFLPLVRRAFSAHTVAG